MSKKVKAGIYRHFKGGIADVIGEAKDPETGEELVLYYHTEKETGKYILWARPKKMFLETVEVKGETVPRFKFLHEKDDKEKN